MTQYFQHSVPLLENQMQQIKTAFNTKKGITIQINFKNKKYDMPLTKAQVEKFKKTKKAFRLKLSATQLRKLKTLQTKEGRVFPLLALLGLAGTVAGASAGIAQAVQSKQANDKALAEAKRHNMAKEAETRKLREQLKIPMPKKGQGFVDWFKDLKKSIPTNKEILANGLYLSRQGAGLYLQPQ